MPSSPDAPPLPSRREWVFETQAVREEFLDELRRALELKGYDVWEGKVHDLGARGPGGRVFVRVGYEERGLHVEATMKPTLVLGSARALGDAVLECGRWAQARLMGRDGDGA